MDKGKLDIDPRGLIFEAYRIEGIGAEECRSIFLDWAMGTAAGADMEAMLLTLMEEYGARAPDHPMTAILREGLSRAAPPSRRRGGRSGRRR